MLQVGTTTVVQVGLWVTTAQWTLLQHQNVIIDISCYEKKIVVGISTVDNQHQVQRWELAPDQNWDTYIFYRY